MKEQSRRAGFPGLPGEGMFTGVAVEIDEGNRILTTLPVIPVQR